MRYKSIGLFNVSHYSDENDSDKNEIEFLIGFVSHVRVLSVLFKLFMVHTFVGHFPQFRTGN